MKATPSMMSESADKVSTILNKLLGQHRGITEIVMLLNNQSNPDSLVLKHREEGTEISTARLSKYLIQHPNIVAIKLGESERAPRVFMWTGSRILPYANRPDSETYLKPEERV